MVLETNGWYKKVPLHFRRPVTAFCGIGRCWKIPSRIGRTPHLLPQTSPRFFQHKTTSFPPLEPKSILSSLYSSQIFRDFNYISNRLSAALGFLHLNTPIKILRIDIFVYLRFHYSAHPPSRISHLRPKWRQQ